MKTRRLFRENVYQAEGSATVASVQTLDGNTVVNIFSAACFSGSMVVLTVDSIWEIST